MATRPRNGSGRANRVAPDGSTHAVADRGLFWGNRGALLDARGDLARHHRGRLWICCVLEFHCRHRTQWQPGRLTELYFLDEPTALAAGHRPCGECRHHDYRRFRDAWARAHPGDEARAGPIDRHLHTDRLTAGGRRTHEAALGSLPDGVVLAHDDGFWLVGGDTLHRWSHAGYVEARPRGTFPSTVTVLTPRATVATLRAGYEPIHHPSAGTATTPRP
ncbi:MAG TPA: hypothetical protein VGH76_00460 [Actinomycetospora sp.]|uniref:hypothetical protein n=1 Tax=Actinomycetospora sp. TaxID=1872135 RepID=UPI002F414007